jgi:hypothetical protein
MLGSHTGLIGTSFSLDLQERQIAAGLCAFQVKWGGFVPFFGLVCGFDQPTFSWILLVF